MVTQGDINLGTYKKSSRVVWNCKNPMMVGNFRLTRETIISVCHHEMRKQCARNIRQDLRMQGIHHTHSMMSVAGSGTSTHIDSESDYNAFGYDPLGLIAHLSHHFFGPEWQPTTFVHLKGLPITAGQPRYGPPSRGQADLSPESFTPQPPPLYYGTPCPPYIEGLSIFNPSIFAALSIRLPRIRDINPSRAACYKKIHGTEVMDGGAFVHRIFHVRLQLT